MPQSANRAPQTRTAYVVEVLRQRIVDGQIQAGQALRQIAIAADLGVSQIPVREALLQLASEGLVDFIPHKGAVALPLTAEEIRELSHLRSLLESDLLRTAIPNLTSACLEQATAVLAEFEALLDSGQEVSRWGELNSQFHSIIYSAAKRPASMQLVENLQRKADRYIQLQLLMTDWIPQAKNEHRELLALCRDREIEAAATLLDQHIQDAGEAIANLL
jgi:DNA-binding GntR family transcriptional regulator